MIRTRIVILATTASLAATGALAPSAIAGSHWSRARCSNIYLAWYKHHFGNKGPTTQKQSKEATAYINKLKREHHCVFGG